MSDGSNPLYICSQNGHTDVAEMLLTQLGVKVDEQRDTGATPFLIACEEGHGEVGRLLAAHGADINRPNNAGATPFYVACQNGHGTIVDLLVELGADITAPLTNGATPMLVACERNHTDVVQKLMDLNLEPPALPCSSEQERPSDGPTLEPSITAESSALPQADYLGQFCMDDPAETCSEKDSTADWGNVPQWLSGAIAAVSPVKTDRGAPKAWAGVWAAGDILAKVTGGGARRRSEETGTASSFSSTSSSGSEGDPEPEPLEVV